MATLNAKSERSRATELALRVALTTMKERCVSLQRRLMILEEKQEMHDQGNGQTGTSPKLNGHTGGAAENLQLRLQVADLQRQKTQLNELYQLVSSENRKLWSRLSQIAKEQHKIESPNCTDLTLTNSSEIDVTSQIDESNSTDEKGNSSNGGANQNLIRSKTFTQHSPNPHLRHKLLTADLNNDMKDISFEEINLGGFNEVEDDLNDDGAGAGEEFADATEAELAFAYLDVNETSNILNESDFNCETKKIIDGLQEMRREAMKQNKDLNSAFTSLKSKIYLQPCLECTQKCKKPETADKSLETDDSLNDIPIQTNFNQNKEWNCNGLPTSNNNNNTVVTNATPTTHINIIQEKIEADDRDKICPMCGKNFNSLVTFELFREHVELHFIEDMSSIEDSVERFERLQPVGDF